MTDFYNLDAPAPGNMTSSLHLLLHCLTLCQPHTIVLLLSETETYKANYEDVAKFAIAEHLNVSLTLIDYPPSAAGDFLRKVIIGNVGVLTTITEN